MRFGIHHRASQQSDTDIDPVQRGIRVMRAVMSIATERMIDRSASARHGAVKPLTGASTTTMGITGMTCAACVMRVEKALRKVPGVVEASVNLASERAAVTFDPAQVSRDDFESAVRRA